MAFKERRKVKTDSYNAKISYDEKTKKYIVDLYFDEKIITLTGSYRTITLEIMKLIKFARDIIDEVQLIEIYERKKKKNEKTPQKNPENKD